MADALVERRPASRFFCHRCNIEFEDILQDYICPYCASGFIEQLESEAEGSLLSEDDVSDADMSNLDDSDDMHQVESPMATRLLVSGSDVVSAAIAAAAAAATSNATAQTIAAAAATSTAAAVAVAQAIAAAAASIASASHPMLDDLAFLMSGGRTRGSGGRPETLLEQLVWTIGGGGGGGVNVGAPFVLVGAPGDYVLGGEGLDAVVTQLLGQLENAGPPPLPREQIAAIPSEAITAEQAAANTSCSVCWENFLEGEQISTLECTHIFHSSCISPWLQLHATCPICRRSLLPEPAAVPPTAPAATAAAAAAATQPATTQPATTQPATDRTPNVIPRVLLRRLPRRLTSGLPSQWDTPPTTSSSSSSVSVSGRWAPRSTAPSTNSTPSSTSTNEQNYNMDIDFD